MRPNQQFNNMLKPVLITPPSTPMFWYSSQVDFRDEPYSNMDLSGGNISYVISSLSGINAAYATPTVQGLTSNGSYTTTQFYVFKNGLNRIVYSYDSVDPTNNQNRGQTGLVGISANSLRIYSGWINYPGLPTINTRFATYSNTEWNLIKLTATYSSSSQLINGVINGRTMVATSSLADYTTTGGSGKSKMDFTNSSIEIAEIIIYSGILSNSNILSIENYLKQKWNLSY